MPPEAGILWLKAQGGQSSMLPLHSERLGAEYISLFQMERTAQGLTERVWVQSQR